MNNAERAKERVDLLRKYFLPDEAPSPIDESSQEYYAVCGTLDDIEKTLRAQSEAERKIEKIMEWCLSDQEVANPNENIGMERAQCDILEILEGAE